MLGSRVVNLAKKENFNTIDGGGVDIALVGGCTKANVMEDGRNVLFP
jgi:hypothetical protein